MAIWDKATKGITDASKTSAETSNLKKKITYERQRINEIFNEIGRRFYDNRDGDHAAELELCADIDDRKRRIASMEGDLSTIKGIRVCPNCGARFDEKYTFSFCGNCGAKLEVDENADA